MFDRVLNKLLGSSLSYFENQDIINPFAPNALFLFPLKTSENRKVFRCFQGVEKGCIGNEWVNDVIFLKIIFHFYNLFAVVDKVIGALLHSQYDYTNSNKF